MVMELSSVPVYASTSKGTVEERRDLILSIMEELETLLDTEYETVNEEIKTEITDKDYDFNTTMETFYDNENPYKDVDYLELIATYASIRQYMEAYGKSTGIGLSSVQFLKYDITKLSMEEEVPKVIENYKEVEDGLYERDGNRVIKEETVVPVYEAFTATKYKITGEETISPEKTIVDYGEVVVTYVGVDAMYEAFGVRKEAVEEIYDEKYQMFDEAINGKALSQSIFVGMPTNTLIPDDVLEMLDSIPMNEAQANIIKVALSLYGKVPYLWGGKASQAGYDNSWWTYNENNQQKGLDCSGYIQWIYMTAGYEQKVTDELISTSVMQSTLEDITESELQPGDLGLLNHGKTTNHVGMYLGNGYFIHCSSGANTVVIDQFSFRYFKRVQNSTEKGLTNSNNTEYSIREFTNSEFANQETTQSNYQTEESDERLLAQLMIHEAGNQGFNGKVAVGEVVMNRIKAGYGTTIKEIVYAQNQFSKSEEIEYIEPDEDTLLMASEIIHGTLSVLNNSNVLFFRNPKITSNISPEDNIAWGNHQWYMCINQHAFYTL